MDILALVVTLLALDVIGKGVISGREAVLEPEIGYSELNSSDVGIIEFDSVRLTTAELSLSERAEFPTVGPVFPEIPLVPYEIPADMADRESVGDKLGGVEEEITVDALAAAEGNGAPEDEMGGEDERMPEGKPAVGKGFRDDKSELELCTDDAAADALRADEA